MQLPGLMSALRLGSSVVADRQAVGREDVALLAVHVVEQRDARRAVRVVLDGRDLGGDADLVPLPVDDAVALLVAAAAEARGDAAVVVAAAGARLVLGERAGARSLVISLKSETE